MKTIELKIRGDGTVFNPKMAWFVLGDHGKSDEGEHHLSASCASVGEVEEQAARLKKLIDEGVAKARRKFAQ